jgi:hypothetical protein
MALSEAQRVKFLTHVHGTPDAIDAALEQLLLDELISVDEAEELLAEDNQERCPECDWWVEAGELVGEEFEDQSCASCRGALV